MKQLLVILLLILPGLPAMAQVGARRATVTAAVNATAVPAGQEAVVAVIVDVKPGFHAQSHKPKDPNLIPLTVTPEKPDVGTVGEVVYPPGQDETYPRLGTLNVYTGKVVFYVPVTIPDDAPPGPALFKGKIRFQICDDKSCFAPETRTWSVGTEVVAKGEAAKPNEPELFKAYQPTRGGGRAATAPSATQPTTKKAAAGAPPLVIDERPPALGILAALGSAFLAGILFNIVPCVLPMLPIKVLGFAQVAGNDRGKTVGLASVFGLGIVSVFAALAVFIFVLKKISWGQQFANPYFAWAMVAVMLLLSLWLFGLLNVNLPGKLYGFQPSHETLTGNFELGMLTAVLSTPCTGPLFPPLMFWAQSQPTAVGVLVMMMVGVGMAFPYVLLSAFPEAARKFPRTGAWADLFKQMLGFVLLAFTVFFAAGRFTTPAGQWWAAVPVVAMGAFYLMARTVQLSKEARPVGIASLISVGMVTASVLVACRFSGFLDPRAAGGAGAATELVNWLPYSDDTIEAARKADKIVLIKFTANWCLNCQLVEGNVYHDARAAEALRRHGVVTVKADLTKDDAPGWERLRELTGSGGIPLTAIYVPGYDKPIQISSVYTTDTLTKTLDRVDGSATALLK
jgi:thiol:disulfide interchange protein